MEKREGLLVCIHNFTLRCVAERYPAIRNTTVKLMEVHCPNYSLPKNNKSWNVGITFNLQSQKCKMQRSNNACGKHTVWELSQMWMKYSRIQ